MMRQMGQRRHSTLSQLNHQQERRCLYRMGSQCRQITIKKGQIFISSLTVVIVQDKMIDAVGKLGVLLFMVCTGEDIISIQCNSVRLKNKAKVSEKNSYFEIYPRKITSHADTLS